MQAGPPRRPAEGQGAAGCAAAGPPGASRVYLRFVLPHRGRRPGVDGCARCLVVFHPLPGLSVSLHAAASPDAFLPSTRLTRLAFDRRSAAFDQLDFLFGEIGQRMQERMQLIRLTPGRALDIGCGHGQGLAALRAQYPDAQIAGLDVSAAMLREAGQRDPQRRPGWIGRMLGKRPLFELVQGDLATLPFAADSFDMLWSNLALHWHPEPHLVFPEWHRVTRTDGLVLFSLFGPDTLKELREAFAEVDGDVHTLRFVDMHDIGDMLVHSGWSTPVMDMETLTITYENPQTLLREVHAMGGLRRPGGGLRGRRWHAALLAALERRRNAQGEIALTFEVVYGHAWKLPPRAGQPLDAQGNAVVPLDRIGRGRPRA
ncbi:amidophosphoribosyltransferase [Cupriavidus sp. USMAHM13]|nr:amidophosphoribosyltransferase [Cupriavidus sp. USMAHM13]